MKLSSKIKLHPLTIVLILVSFLTGYVKYLLLIFLIVLIHESGHIFTAILFKRKITKIELLPFGGLTKMDSLVSENIFEDLLIATGGIFFQTILGFILILLNNYAVISPKTFYFLSTYNTFIILFNLVPVCPLDGYRILKLFTELFIPFKKTFNMSFLISILVISGVFMLKLELIKDNLFVFFFLIFSIIEEIKNKKFVMFRFYIERSSRDFDYKRKDIKKIDDMYKNRCNYISNKHEHIFLKYFLNR